MNEKAHRPEDAAPASGYYEELNVLGIRTGTVVHITEGERLPKAPPGFTWRKLDTDGK
jgi:hypothetical protein